MNVADLSRFLAGLALFLYGLQIFETALKNLSGRRFKQIIERQTRTTLGSIATGAISSAILQSSSVVSLMVLALVGAGALNLKNAIGVILGSNLGTTMTGWLVAFVGFKFSISKFVLSLLAMGAFIKFLGSKKKLASLSGESIFGFALIFMGLDFMKEGMSALSATFDVASLQGHPLIIYTLFGFFLTALIQSSSATMMMCLTAVHAEIISVPTAMAVVIGADMGTTITVVMGALRGSATKRRVAASHFLFNIFTGLMAFLFIGPFYEFIHNVMKVTDPLVSLVTFHSLFNFLGILVFIPLLQPFSQFLERLFLKDPQKEAQFIRDVTPSMPDVALEALTKETERLCQAAIELNLRYLGVIHEKASAHSLFRAHETKTQAYERLKRLEGEILTTLIQLQEGALAEPESTRVAQITSAIRHAVHATKSIRDIRHNIKDFQASSDRKIIQFQKQIQDQSRSLYLTLNHFFEMHEPEVLFQEIQEALQEVDRTHAAFHTSIIEEVRQEGLDEVQISTLFNVNREIYNSHRSLLRALAELRLRTKDVDHLF